MDNKDWYLLQLVYEEQNLTRAAQRFHITQPALTYRLAQIEKQLDIKLYIKTKTGIQFTPEGELAYQYAQNMSQQYLTFLDEMNETKKELYGEIRIGANSNILQYELIDIIEKFKLKYPNVRFKIDSGTNFKIWNDMLKDKYHLVLIRGDYMWNDGKTVLLQDQVCIMSTQPIELEHLPTYKRVIQKMDSQVAEEDHKWWYERYKTPQNIFVEVDNPETCKQMMLKGIGYCALPYSIIRREVEIDKLPLYIIPMYFLDGTPFLRNQWLLYKEDLTKLKFIRAFIEEIQNHFTIV